MGTEAAQLSPYMMEMISAEQVNITTAIAAPTSEQSLAMRSQHSKITSGSSWWAAM